MAAPTTENGSGRGMPSTLMLAGMPRADRADTPAAALGGSHGGGDGRTELFGGRFPTEVGSGHLSLGEDLFDRGFH